ncbi:MAG: hypothetical protein ACYDHZ_00730 [Dehalococcoidia bacterium]
MRLKIPMTGTVIDFDPEAAKLDGIGIVGDPTDPVRPININLGGIFWKLVSIDLDNDLMEVEASAQDNADVPMLDSKGKAVFDANGQQKYVTHLLTDAEKQAVLDNAQAILDGMTNEAMHALTKDKALVKSVAVIYKYQAAKAQTLPKNQDSLPRVRE